MTTDDILLDPVADGAPRTHDRVEVALIVLMAAVAVGEIYTGQYWHAIDSAMIAALFYLYGKMRRVQWIAGYVAAVETIADQTESEVDY